MPDKTLKDLTNILTAGGTKDSDIAYIVRPATNADYKTTLGDLKTSLIRKPQIVATHNSIPLGVVAANSGGRTDVQQQIRMGHWIGSSDVSQLQLGMVGFYTPLFDNTGDKPIGSDFTWEAAIELTSPVLTRSAFIGASKVTSFSNNSPLVLTNPLVENVAAGSAIFTRQAFVIPDYTTGKFYTTTRASYSGSSVLSPISTSQVPATGALTVPAGGISAATRTFPAVILGIPKNPMPAVLIIGDSISAGVGDSAADARGMIGYIARGLDNVNGYAVPWHVQTVAGWALEGQKLQLSPGTRDVWPYCTHVIFALGTNDMSGSTLADMQAKTTAALTELKRVIGPYGKPLHITCATIVPNTTSTNSWIDAAGQTPISHYAAGEKRDQYNTWLLSLAGGDLVDQILDLRAATEDPSDNSRWFTNGTAFFPTNDGGHPRTGVVTRMAAVVNTWAQGIKP